MLSIHFSFADLARTRLATGPDPLWEIVLSIQLLQNREGAVAFRHWREHARAHGGPSARMLMTLAPHAAYFPDFLTPEYEGGHVEQGIDAVLSTPNTRMSNELALLSAYRKLPGWCTRLADGDVETATRLGAAFRTYHRTVIGQYWPSIQAHVGADRARRSRDMATGGVEGLLSSFHPLMHWRPPVLEVDYPVHRELVLDGRGLLLIPSFFCWRRPVALVDPGSRPVLVYPVEHDPRATRVTEGPVAGDPLAALLGRNRAAILKALQDGCGTTELSRRSGTSVASASQHATVLREAGLITTQRRGGVALHTLTPLGADLVAEN